MAAHNDLGRAGEQMAARFLSMRGMQIIHQNWRAGRDELDMVVRSGNSLIFVEVKTRSSDRFDQPEDAIDSAKQQKMLRAAGRYIEANPHHGPVRFDVISIVLAGHMSKLFYMPDAFFPIGG